MNSATAWDARVALFRQQAAAVSTTVLERKDTAGALEYALDLCAENRRAGRPDTLAAPGLPPALLDILTAAGVEPATGLRQRPEGVGVGFSLAVAGVAETATLVLASADPDLDEEARLASMLCERHVVALPRRAIVETLPEAGAALRDLLARGPAYVAFVSGCSRTSDIERVLTLGVHGPLELHVVLTE